MSRQVSLLEALKEVSSAEGSAGSEGESSPWLSQEYKDVLASAEQIKKEHSRRPQLLMYLCGLITDLFVDRHRLRGVDVRHRILEVQAVITDYDFNKLLDVFSPSFQS